MRERDSWGVVRIKKNKSPEHLLPEAQLPQDEQQSLWLQRIMPTASEQTAITLYLKLNPGFMVSSWFECGWGLEDMEQ